MSKLYVSQPDTKTILFSNRIIAQVDTNHGGRKRLDRLCTLQWSTGIPCEHEVEKNDSPKARKGGGGA